MLSRAFIVAVALVCGCASRRDPPLPAPSQRGPDPRLAGLDTLVGGSRVYLETEVDRPALATSAPPFPSYPTDLKSRGLEGRVEYLFVVDTAGLVEVSTVQLLSASHPGFAAAVRAILPWRRFLPAERGGKRVRMWTIQAFEFRLGP